MTTLSRLKWYREINERAYEAQKDLPRSLLNRMFSWFWHMMAYPIWFLPGFITMWPEPICETDGDKLERCGWGSLTYSTMDTNFFWAAGGFVTVAIVWMVLGKVFKVKPQKFAMWRVVLLILLIPFGLAAGLAWNATVGVTGWDQCYQKKGAHVIGKHWRPEVRAFTGMDSIFGIDMTIPRSRTYDIRNYYKKPAATRKLTR